MLFLLISTFPPNKGPEIGKQGLKAVEKPVPPYVKVLGMWATCGGQLGTKFYSLYEVEKGKVEEGFKWIQLSSIPFESIEGMRSKVEILTPVEEAMAMIGLAST